MGIGAAVVARLTWRSLLTGQVSANWQEVRRDQHPSVFWGLIVLHLVVVGLFLRAAANCLFR